MVKEWPELYSRILQMMVDEENSQQSHGRLHL